MYLKLFRTPTLVLNSLTVARDLLDKRSAKYSDRTRMVLMREMYVRSKTTIATQSALAARWSSALLWIVALELLLTAYVFFLHAGSGSLTHS